MFDRFILTMDIFILIILAITPGVWSGDWKVTLTNSCAYRGTSTVLKCEYFYPDDDIVTEVNWLKLKWVRSYRTYVRVSDLSASPDHFRFAGNYRHVCDLKIDDVQPADQGMYYFSFVTTSDTWRSRSFAYLTVTEVTITLEPNFVSEGENVTIECHLPCGSSLRSVWFRDGQPFNHSGKQFQARREDAGEYHCGAAISRRILTNSTSVNLTVHYAPKNVTVTLPEKVIAGSLVTITCSSEANPAVKPEEYKFFKDGQLIMSGPNVTITGICPNDTGLYHCTAKNNITWMGDYVMNSTEMYLDVLYGPTTMLVSMSANVTAEGSSVDMNCSSEANPEADNYTWYRRTDSNSSMLLVGSGKVLTLQAAKASDEGLYMCQARNSVGESNSSEVQLIVEKITQESHFQQMIIIGLASLAALLVMVTLLLLIWNKKRKVKAEETTSPEDDQLDNVYANPMETCLPSPSPHSGQRSQRESLQIYNTPSSEDDDVTYTTVTIKHRNPDHTDNDQESCPKAAETGEAVIYATVKSK